MYKLECYVPEDYLESVSKSLFNAGIGSFGDYESCAWSVLGCGRFKPKAGAKPFIGTVGRVQHVCEYKLEVMVPEHLLKSAITILKDAHPYEQPVYAVLACMDV